jgi:hypothetical protein
MNAHRSCDRYLYGFQPSGPDGEGHAGGQARWARGNLGERVALDLVSSFGIYHYRQIAIFLM